tara:strand:+ start:2578 stop:3765 length:1188 start_codon:yes stop_codon:yes gene_type:complete
MATEIKVPALGESVSEATVASWLKKEGESVSANEPIVELETDKVTLEVNAPADGVITEIKAQEGDNVEKDALLAIFEEGASGTASKSEETPKEEKKEEKASSKSSDEKASSPSARKLADNNDVKIDDVKGSGKDGRVMKEDVQSHMSSSGGSSSSSAPAADRGPREERVKMTRLRQRIAERLMDSQHSTATLTTFNDIDMSEVMKVRKSYKDAFEKRHGIKLGFMSFFMKAAVHALQKIPSVNAEIQGDEVVYKNYYDIGCAVSTPQGLVVPVVRDVDTKSFADIEGDIMDLGSRARDGKLSMEEMMGGTFTVTNGGVFGSMLSTPILNPPQSGILGMHRIEERPVVRNGEIVVRPMMYVALSYDHRIIDGRESVTFLKTIKECIEDPQRLLLDL